MKFYIFYLIVTLIVGITSYVTTDNLIYCIVATILFIGYFIFFDFVIKKKAMINKRKKDDLNIFLHDFISIYFNEPDIDKSIEFATYQVSNELKEELKMLEEYKSIDKLEHLTNYFSNNLYGLFLETLKKKEGDKKGLMYFVKKENNLLYEENNEFNKGIKKTILEYLILWLIASLILVSMRFAIHNYFSKVSSSAFYLIGVSLFYLVFIISIHFLVRGCVKKYEQN